MKQIILASLIALGFVSQVHASANVGCISKYEVVPSQICVGSEVVLRNGSGEPRAGTVLAINPGGQVLIRYYYNGNNEVWRHYTEVSARVQTLQNLRDGDAVFLRNGSGEERDGTITSLFANGGVRIHYYYNGDNNVFRSYQEIQKAVPAVGAFVVNGIVHLRNGSGEERVGRILLLTQARAKITYEYNGTNVVYRSLQEIAAEAQCVGNLCKGSQVYLSNGSGQPRLGVILNAFRNGRIYIRYEYNGTNLVFRHYNEVSLVAPHHPVPKP